MSQVLGTTPEVNVRIDPDGRMRTREIGKGEARIVRLEGQW